MHRFRRVLAVLCVASAAATASATPQAIHLFSTFEPWIQISASGSVEIDAEMALFAGGAMRITTDGDGANVHGAMTGLAPLNVERRALSLWVRVDEVGALNELRVYLGSDETFADRVVYMIDRDRTQLVSGTWLRVTLPPSEGQPWGTPDLTAITAIQLWVNDRGERPVTVHIDGLAIEEPAGADDSAAVAFTFDDGWRDQLTEAAPILARYGFGATAYVIPELVGSDGYMSEADHEILVAEYGWEIGAHALGPLTEGGTDERRARIDALADWFAARGRDSATVDLAYPNGAFDAEVLELVAARFRSARTIVEFGETRPPGDPHRIRVFNVLADTPVERVAEAATRARAGGELLVLVLHRVADQIVAETVVTPERFAEIVDAVAASGVPVVTIGQILAGVVPVRPESIVWDEEFRIDLAPPDGEERDAPAPVEVAPAAGAGSRDTAPGPRLAPESVVTASAAELGFGFDLKMVSGLGTDGVRRYFSQIDELFVSISRPVGDYARLSAIAGVLPVTFDDLATGRIGGADLYIDEIVLRDRIGARLLPGLGVDLAIAAGYRDWGPRNKWLQVTQWSAIESPFGQDITPKTIWLSAEVDGTGWFATVAASPDLVGVTRAGALELTDNPGSGSTRGAGLPQLFFDGGAEVGVGATGSLLAESALAVGGDAIKWATMVRHDTRSAPWSVASSLGTRLTWGSTFTTYPSWDPHVDGGYTVSAGLAPGWRNGDRLSVTAGLSASWAARIDGSAPGVVQLGIDGRVIGEGWEVFAGLATRDPDRWDSSATAARSFGWEAGIALDGGGVRYMAGYTTAGFAMRSGLYANRVGTGEEGADGVFLRVQTSR